MKILLVGFSKIKYMPYIRFYLDNIAKSNTVRVAYWNRDGRAEDLSDYPRVEFHEFSSYQEDNVARVSKIGNFIKFRKFVKRLLLADSYDLVVCLHTFPCILLSDVLLRRYRGRYIFDYRDRTYEGIYPFKKRVETMIANSCVTFVSSEGFKRSFNSRVYPKIQLSHNILRDSLDHREDKALYGVSSDKIRLAFWGFIRDEELNRALIRRVSEDGRFELHYYGREQRIAASLKAYAAQLGAENVVFHGEYRAEDRYVFVRHTDLIHNAFDDKNMMIAMSNKYYDGAIFRLPQLCFSGSFMGEMAERAGIGLACDPYRADFTQRVYEYYTGLDKQKFGIACDAELERILLEYEQGCRIVGRATGEAEQ